MPRPDRRGPGGPGARSICDSRMAAARTIPTRHILVCVASSHPARQFGAADCGEYRQAAGAVEPPSEVGSAMRRNSDVRFRG